MSETVAKIAIVTGAGQGIARAVAERLAGQGWGLAILDLDADKATQSAAEISTTAGVSTVGLGCDVRDSAQVNRAVAAAAEHHGRVDSLINAAGGYVANRPLHETTDEEWDLVVGSNLTGYFYMIRAVAPLMLAQGSGVILNFASNAARSTATSLGAEYTAAKTGVLGLTRHAAREYAASGIRVNAIAPGPTSGGRLSTLSSENELDNIAAHVPLGRLGEPHDIAAVAAFLVSDEAGFMTGATVDVNGGIIMV